MATALFFNTARFQASACTLAQFISMTTAAAPALRAEETATSAAQSASATHTSTNAEQPTNANRQRAGNQSTPSVILFDVEAAYRQLRDHEDQLLDLQNIQLRIDEVKSALDQSAVEAAKKIDIALKELKASFPPGANTPPSDADVNFKFSALYDAVFDPNENWRTIVERPPGKSSIVRQRKLNSAWQSIDELLDPKSSLVALKRKVDSGKRDKAFIDEVSNLSYDELKSEYQTCLEKAKAKMSELKNKITKIRKEEVEPNLREAQTRIAQLQQTAFLGQQDTFRSVNYMMVLLAVMFVVSVIAKLIAVYLKVDAYGILTERTLIEFGGMAFILLTIILLGNTEKLDKQALGTLLGTIAGYIFGKGIVAASNERIQRDSADIPKADKKP